MSGKYKRLIAEIFRSHYRGKKTKKFGFDRDEVTARAGEIGVSPPKNLGDLIYSFRYGSRLPGEVLETAPEGKEWIIVGRGPAVYEFTLIDKVDIAPGNDMIPTKISRRIAGSVGHDRNRLPCLVQ